MRGDSGVAGERRVAGVPKFHSWGKYTMPLTNINLDWMSNASSGLCSAASPVLARSMPTVFVYVIYRPADSACAETC